MQPAYVGIDVACAKKKFLPISVCVRRGDRLSPLPLRALALRPPRGGGNVRALEEQNRETFAQETAAYLRQVEAVCSVKIVRIALDAPASACPPTLSKRHAENALDALGISYFKTPSEAQFAQIQAKAKVHLVAGSSAARLPHANQIWMLVGFALFTHLSQLWECLEVYPQATVSLLGCGALHKSHPSGLSAQTKAVGELLGWEERALSRALRASGFGKLHDQFDAYLAAWVASLEERKRNALGVPPDDAIWVPRVGV